MPTIVDKLRRYPNMQLTTMQDIGGIRAVVPTLPEVRKLADEYESSRRFAHELSAKRDYISDPRDEDGYRSLHLIYKYRNRGSPAYDGLRVELQIRTRLQHVWATAVETMGTYLGQALKSRQGDQEWLDFFALTSSAFAFMENTRPISRFGDLSQAETSRAIVDAESKLGAVEMMSAFSIATEHIAEDEKSWSYHLIVLDSLAKTVHVTAYDRTAFEQALSDYTDKEQDAASGMKIEPVLVSAGRIHALRRAYPNFFLDIGEFAVHVRGILAAV